MKKLIKYWFKDFFKKPVKILITLALLLFITATFSQDSDIIYDIAIILGIITGVYTFGLFILGIINYIKLNKLMNKK
jgi:hypothetical protein